MQLANKKAKIFSTSLVIREMQIKITRNHAIPTIMAGIKKTDNIQVWWWCGLSGICIHSCWKSTTLENNWAVSTGNTEVDFKRWPFTCLSAIYFWNLPKRKRQLGASVAQRADQRSGLWGRPHGPGTKGRGAPRSRGEEDSTQLVFAPHQAPHSGSQEGGTLHSPCLWGHEGDRGRAESSPAEPQPPRPRPPACSQRPLS